MLKTARVIKLSKIKDPRGNLSFIEEINHIPFEIQRTYWIYDVPGGEIRGGHAFKEQQEIIVALSGSFNVKLHDGDNGKHFFLNRSYYGLYVPAGIWRQMDDFSTNSVALVLSSTHYNKNDYIRKFEKFIEYIKNGKNNL
jgi:hypothetical protein